MTYWNNNNVITAVQTKLHSYIQNRIDIIFGTMYNERYNKIQPFIYITIFFEDHMSGI